MSSMAPAGCISYHEAPRIITPAVYQWARPKALTKTARLRQIIIRPLPNEILAKQIKGELKTGSANCAIYEEELQRIWRVD